MFEWENTCSRATAAQGEKEEKKETDHSLSLSLSHAMCPGSEIMKSPCRFRLNVEKQMHKKSPSVIPLFSYAKHNIP